MNIHDGRVSQDNVHLSCGSLINLRFYNIDYWSKGVEPGKMWDRVGPSPLLLKYVESTDYIPVGRALVPGCGRGYDLCIGQCRTHCYWSGYI